MTNVATGMGEADNIPNFSEIYNPPIDATPLGPVCQLPTETWIKIFRETLAMVISDRVNDSGTTRVHPTLSIASISRRWRNIALGTPDLWSYIPIYKLISPDFTIRLNGITKIVRTRTKGTKELFIDFGGVFTPLDDIPTSTQAKVDAVVTSIEIALGTHHPLETQIAIYWPTRAYLALPLCSSVQRLQSYRLYNLFPKFSTRYPNQVKSLIIRLRMTPEFEVILSALDQCPNLVHLELDYPCAFLFYPTSFPMNPLLQTLAVRFTLMPLFFGEYRSISNVITSLHITLNMSSLTMTTENWVRTVEGSGLSTNLRYLGLEVVEHLIFEDWLIVHLLGRLRGVITLALYGSAVAPGLNTLNARYTLLPALHRLEIVCAHVDPTKVAMLLDSPRHARIGELVFNQCGGITQEFCEEMKEKVNRLIVRA